MVNLFVKNHAADAVGLWLTFLISVVYHFREINETSKSVHSIKQLNQAFSIKINLLLISDKVKLHGHLVKVLTYEFILFPKIWLTTLEI